MSTVILACQWQPDRIITPYGGDDGPRTPLTPLAYCNAFDRLIEGGPSCGRVALASGGDYVGSLHSSRHRSHSGIHGYPNHPQPIQVGF